MAVMCAKCGSRMESGVVGAKNAPNLVFQVQGPQGVALTTMTGLDSAADLAGRTYPLRAVRCKHCGYVEFYATRHEAEP